ncbi:hypothetical protein N0V88_001792 [Collariella sp. IMI 366227]|nr:hypothetical protein N0V88_001792 [Collariella sp. IMI 366227]
MATNGNVNMPEQYAAPAQTDAPAHAETSNAPLPKDEVGWYFVEQYYTTLAKSPERLHLFYSKKSQFVSGREAEVVQVSLGRQVGRSSLLPIHTFRTDAREQAIQERIKGLEFQDCKVRISNVDTQGSDENIVIQVIGEIGKGESKKFVQTFVLAQQPSGYFVLNDILRYMDDDVEETAAEEPTATLEAPAPVEAETKSETPAPEEVEEKETAPLDTAAVTEKLEEAAVEPPAAEEAPAAESPAAEPAAEEEVAPVEETPVEADVEKTVEEIAEEEVKKPEEPKDPALHPPLRPRPRLRRSALPLRPLLRPSPRSPRSP